MKQKKIIKEYLEDLSKRKTPPVVLSNKGSMVGFNAEVKPTTFDEATKLVEKMFRS